MRARNTRFILVPLCCELTPSRAQAIIKAWERGCTRYGFCQLVFVGGREYVSHARIIMHAEGSDSTCTAQRKWDEFYYIDLESVCCEIEANIRSGYLGIFDAFYALQIHPTIGVRNNTAYAFVSCRDVPPLLFQEIIDIITLITVRLYWRIRSRRSIRIRFMPQHTLLRMFASMLHGGDAVLERS